MPKKKVLHIIQSLGRGGCEMMLLDILPRLRDKGWENIVITLQPGGVLEPQYREAGVQVLTIDSKHLFDLHSLLRLRSLLRSLQPTLVCTYLLRADIIGRFFLQLFSPVPVIPHLVTTYNHPRYRVARLFEWITRPFVKHYFANSEAVKNYYEQHLNVKLGRIVAIASGINLHKFENARGEAIREEFNLSPDDLLITCVANLAPNKGQCFLLQAFEQTFRENPRAYLFLVGEGQEHANLLLQWKRLRSKEHILFLGRRGDVPNILAASDIFVLPTLFEGMSIALLEAMAAGKAIITTNIPENKPLFPDERFGRLVPPRNVSDLANELIHLSRDASLRKSLGENARERAKGHFSLDTQVSQLDQAFSSFIKEELKILPNKTGRRKRILHIIQSLGNGGCENALLRILPILDNYEHRILTLKEPGLLSEKFSSQGITVRTIGMQRIVSWRSYPALFKEITEFSPDIIFTYLLHADIIGRLFLQIKFRIPIIPFLRTTYNHPRYRLARILEWLTKPLAKRYLANSEAVKDYYTNNIGVHPERIIVIPNGIDTASYEHTDGSKIVQELHLPKNRFVITCVANLAENKGHRYLLEAFERLHISPLSQNGKPRSESEKSLFLLLVGDGPGKKKLQDQIKDYQSRKQVFFLDQRSDIPDILKVSDCFVLPTLFEGMSNALLEAMAARLPVITTDIPENRLLIINEKNGILVRKKDSQELVRAISRLEKNIPYSETLAKNAQLSVQASFSLEKIAQKWNDFLTHIL